MDLSEIPSWRVITLKFPGAWEISGGFAIIEGSRHHVDIVTCDEIPLSLEQLQFVAEQERNHRAAARKRKKALTRRPR